MMTTPLDPLDDLDRDTTGGRWLRCQFASFQTLQKVAAIDTPKSWAVFVWPEEGRFLRTGTFEFNADHQDFQPLMVDRISAQMLVTLHDALQPMSRAKVVDWIAKSRGHFGRIWQLTQERVKIVGFGTRASQNKS